MKTIGSSETGSVSAKILWNIFIEKLKWNEGTVKNKMLHITGFKF